MRPYTNGAAPGTAKKRKGGGKGARAAGAAVKSKVTAVKRATASRLRNESGKEEILDLVSVTPSATTSGAAAGAGRKKGVARAVSGKLQKVKSMVGVGNRHERLDGGTPKKSPTKVKRLQKIKSLAGVPNGHNKLKSSPSAVTPTRKSSRQLARAAAKASATANGNSDGMEVEQAQEAINVANGEAASASSGGFLSRIWRRPSYETVDPAAAASQPRGSCVIS